MRYNHLEMLPEEAFQKVGKSVKLYGKGGGGSTTSTGTTYTTNIPEYAQPYVETMLGATQKQLFQGNTDRFGNYNITGFQPYRPYSTNAQDYVAGFSPMQQQSFQNAANLQTPGQFAGASDLAGASGLGSLGMAGQLANTGNNYARQATNPNAVQAYMNPYLQSALAPQMDAMRRQYGITGAEQQSKATGAGAFGGSREALMAAENYRNMNSAIDSTLAKGYYDAFQNAQQQQQFGANLGLQGNQAALQGLGQAGQAAGTLGQLGMQQLGAQKDIIGLQNQYGNQQQAQQQNMINQSIQDYATAQQYPMMQLGMMSNMLRGLPMQGVTTQSYQATPNALTQGIGALGTGLTLSSALSGKAAGGQIKSYAKGGIASYDVGGEVKNDLYDYSPEKLQEVIKSSQSATVRKLAKEVLQDKSYAPGGIIAFADGDLVDEEKQAVKDRQALKHAGAYLTDVVSLPATLVDKGITSLGNLGFRAINALSGEAKFPTDIESRSISQAQENLFRDDPYYSKQTDKPAAAKPATVAAKPAAEKNKPAQEVKPAKEKPAGAPAAENAAPAQSAAYMPTDQTTTAGILAGAPKSIQDYMNKNPDTGETVAELAAKRQREKEAFLGPDTAGAEYRKTIMDQKANAKEEAERLQKMRLAEFFSVWGTTPGPTLVAGMEAAKKTIPSIIADKADQKKAAAELDKIIYGLDHATRLEKAGNWEEAAKEKEALAKASQTWGGKWMDLAAQASQNRTRLQAEEMSNRSAEKRQAMGDAAQVKAAGIRATADKTEQNALKAQSIWSSVYNSALGRYSAIDPETADEKATAAADAALTPAQRETLGRGAAAAGPTTGSVVMDKSGKKVWQQH
jgi:hypothetical protein